MVLSLGEAHLLFLRVTILVGEDNHEICTREIFRQLIRQTVERVLVTDGSLTGCNYYQQVVWTDVAGQLRQFIPVCHIGVLGTYVGMLTIDVLLNQFHGFIAAMKLNATIQLARKPAQTFQPAMEARLIFRSAWYGYLNLAKGVERLCESHKKNLTVQTIVETLYELTPELAAYLSMDVHTHDYLRTTTLAEGVLDAVGDVSGQSDLRLYLHF